MKNKNLNRYANKLVNAFLNNKIISPLPTKYTKKIFEAQKLRKLCESKISKPIIGFKAAGTGIPMLKKLKEKEPFYATVYKHNVLKNRKKVTNLHLALNLKFVTKLKKISLILKKKLLIKTLKNS